jgi:hypothetical protein
MPRLSAAVKGKYRPAASVGTTWHRGVWRRCARRPRRAGDQEMHTRRPLDRRAGIELCRDEASRTRHWTHLPGRRASIRVRQRNGTFPRRFSTSAISTASAAVRRRSGRLLSVAPVLPSCLRLYVPGGGTASTETVREQARAYTDALSRVTERRPSVRGTSTLFDRIRKPEWKRNGNWIPLR